jgi:hypothetical protein
MKLCTFCTTTILESTSTWAEHHNSYEALKQSSDERCLFCKTLHDGITSIALELQEEGEVKEWPVWRWTIRSLAKIRESLETVVVTFRQIPKGGEGGGGEGGRVKLPTRVFYLFPEDGECSLFLWLFTTFSFYTPPQ